MCGQSTGFVCGGLGRPDDTRSRPTSNSDRSLSMTATCEGSDIEGHIHNCIHIDIFIGLSLQYVRMLIRARRPFQPWILKVIKSLLYPPKSSGPTQHSWRNPSNKSLHQVSRRPYPFPATTSSSLPTKVAISQSSLLARVLRLWSHEDSFLTVTSRDAVL